MGGLSSGGENFNCAISMIVANEQIPEAVVEEVERVIAAEFPEDGHYLKRCHAIWTRKKELFRQHGYDWYDPPQIYPDINEYAMLEANRRIPKAVVEEVESIIDAEFSGETPFMGMCHRIWGRKKELFRQRGYDWYSSSDIYPDVLFD